MTTRLPFGQRVGDVADGFVFVDFIRLGEVNLPAGQTGARMSRDVG